MKKNTIGWLLGTFLVLLAGLPTVASAEPLERVADFALLDHTGKYHRLSYYGDHEVLLLAAHGLDHPGHLSGLADLQAQYPDRQLAIFGLNATDRREDIAASAPSLPVLVDEEQLVAESLGFQRVGEVLIVDPERMVVLGRSALTEAGLVHLQNAVRSTLAGDDTLVDGPAADGPVLVYAARDAHRESVPSYSREIVPILERNCVACHHEGGIGPWAMTNHAMIRGWSAMMREVVMTRRMPPGQIDNHVGREIEGVAGLTGEEKQKLIHWIDAGSPMDGDVDPLTELAFDNPRYSLGEPDLVYRIAPQEIPATGILDYRYIPVELNLEKDVWVRAMEFVPGDRAVLHHVIAYVSSPADRTMRGRETGAARGEQIAGFAPGRQPDEFQDSSGRLLRKGSNLLLQMHYTTSGKETVDETEVAIYLHDSPPEHVMSSGVAGQRRFLVPAHAREHELEGEQLIKRDAYLYEMTPHMHYRGKYMSYTAEYPDGTSEVLLSVPKYEFNWQFSYRLKEPVFLPAGTRLVARGAMDNSDRNPANPDPTKPVHFGLQTRHEMFFGFTTLRYVGDTPEVAGTD